MSRRSILLGLGTLLLLLGGTSGVLVLLVRHEPEDYRNLAVPPDEARQILSKQFYLEFCTLLNGIQNDLEWKAEFSTEQLNSYLVEDFIRSGVSEGIMPPGISEPRLAFENNQIRLAFRYGEEPWSTVITLDLRVWLPPHETNVIALELVRLRAGSLPIVTQTLLERLSEAARRNDIEVRWYRHEGHPVALLRFQPHQLRPTVQLQRFELLPGKVRVGGKSIEEVPPRAQRSGRVGSQPG